MLGRSPRQSELADSSAARGDEGMQARGAEVYRGRAHAADGINCISSFRFLLVLPSNCRFLWI